LIIEVIIVISGVVAIVSSILYFSLSKKTGGNKHEIAIEALSSIWTKHKNMTISIQELANIWREENSQTNKDNEEVKYNHGEIQDIYDRYVKDKTFSNSPAGDVIREILTLLDEEGDCPSVVNSKGEPESYADKNTYDILAQVPLYKHTINVAENMIKAFRNSAAMLPKVLITALGHDLGKLPSMRKKLYSMGDHPLISITILEGLKGYRELQFKDEISRAITEHHRTPKGVLSESLRNADHLARRMEMAELGLNRKDEDEKEDPTPSDTKEDIKSKVKSAKSDTEEEANTNKSMGIFTEVSSEVNKDIFSPPETEKESEHKSIPKEMPLKWFDSDTFLKELKPFINRLDGSRWRSFSMPNGYVYFQTGVIEEVVKKLGKDDPDVALMDSSREMKRNIMFTVIQKLKREKDAIARGLIKETYFGGNFIVTMTHEKPLKGYYTPFLAEAFSESVSSLEELKAGKLKEITKVEPLITSEE